MKWCVHNLSILTVLVLPESQYLSRLALIVLIGKFKLRVKALLIDSFEYCVYKSMLAVYGMPYL